MEAAIFDLDGTLLDSMGLWSRIDADFFAKRGMALPDDYSITVSGFASFEETAAYTIRRFGLEDTVPSLLREWNDMAAHAYAHTVNMKKGAKEYLETLKKRGVKIGIATAASPILYEGALRNLGIGRYFDAICAAGETKDGKNTPAVFYLAARKLNAAPENCVVFEDSLAAMRSAKTAGMKIVAVYEETSKNAWDKIRQIADRTIKDFADPALQDL
jgi:HAD superfamily hydrolase (TIGR01509 family)